MLLAKDVVEGVTNVQNISGSGHDAAYQNDLEPQLEPRLLQQDVQVGHGLT